MSLLSTLLNPVPGFPEYTGPYKVGTVDVEIPISELPSSQKPEGAANIQTVLFRIFYPAVPEAQGKKVTWLPAPQRLHIEAYAQFLGLGSKAASFLSFLPRHLHWTTIPAIKNAALLSPPAEHLGSRWPTMVFSHGLGGNRNAYSHLAGSLASHGVVVICPEHRDQSAALTLIRDPQSAKKTSPFVLPYLRIPHNQTPEIWQQRDSQLRIRLWELDIIFEAILAIDHNDSKVITSNLNSSTPVSAISAFHNKLDILEPGKVIIAGHSFGSSTMVQLLKSVFYSSHPSLDLYTDRLFAPRPDSPMKSQINGCNPTILLDMWSFPLLSAATDSLYRLPLPCYSVPQQQNMSKILAVESDQFFKWGSHLHRTARILSLDPTADIVKATATHPPPYLFYVEKSAHLSQSDFAVLFPWLTKKAFGSETPEVVLSLNVRAMVQFLRGNGVLVADSKLEEERGDVLAREVEVAKWKWVDVVGMGKKMYPSELEMMKEERDKEEVERSRREEKGMEEEMDPGAAKQEDEVKENGTTGGERL
ncbi:platelet-activating factor acetylhydrolase [Triangularia verruculosa]|uniref:Putative phospholipase n=1 Tax=Triangularia verruculosa TaxID=2587418 RepID=A0AAN6XR22_9PEZI|nr:platelet-activating factor acetylhydrolase [Triangularia verruculosa]